MVIIYLIITIVLVKKMFTFNNLQTTEELFLNVRNLIFHRAFRKVG